MSELEKILYNLGYGISDPQKNQEIQGYIDEAVEYMQSKGIDESKINTHTAYTIKNLWAKYRDQGEDEAILKKEGMIVHLILDLRRR